MTHLRTPVRPGRRRGRPRRAAAVLSALVVAGTAAFGFGSTAPAYADGNTLTVNVGTTVRPVTHVAAGGLYGVDTGSTPPLSQLYPLHVNTFTQPPPGTQQLGNGATHPCCDGLQVAGKITDAGGQQYLRLPDVFSTFPYNWVSWPDWESKIGTMISARVDATSTTNIAGYEIWNEPDANWAASTKNDPNAGSYLDMWTRTYRDIRAVDTLTPIIGPGASSYSHDFMLGFMTNAKNTGTLPSVAVWHELGDFSYQDVQAHVTDFRGIEDSLGLPHIPISINEYASPGQVDEPSIGVHYMAAFERAGIHDAERAYWYEAGTMDGLLYNNLPTASYWAYKWYGDQSGNVVQTVPQSYLDGVASYDASRKQVNVVFGGDGGTNTVKVNGLAGLGSQVSVQLSSTNTTGRTTNQAAPNLLSTTTYPVVNGSISVPVSNMDAVAAYQLLITPTSGTPTYQQTYEAENATVVNASRLSSSTASNVGYVGRIDGNGDARTDSFVDFLVDVPTARSYTMTIKYANATGATATQGLASDGGAFSTVSYPPTTSGWGNPTGSVDVTVQLRAGYDVIRLAKGSPNYAGGTGYAELDSIHLQ
ncbi:CBM35 domain-containing protein [Curtobacterium sp. MCBA15_004]|uniref:CBM35 domain-containing protein n=1 Tax=unclassified Curtobacterium TaxID=257496 RepID=UPI0009F72EF5|nr:CBM35 domain-containing protein [Curtobacterium sp. MCBA15_004]WIA97115.1 CBM35 domain-containing protein [Curtobacterium sp. MCBA15_004]